MNGATTRLIAWIHHIEAVPLDATVPPDAWVNEALREQLSPLIPFFELITHLGDGAVLIGLAIALYWFGYSENRRRRAWLLAIGLLGFALVAGIKGVIAAPRPEVAFAPEFYPGYSFPSAHALGATVFYGGLAVSMYIGKRWWRYLSAGLVIALVGLSRVILGVHFLADVIIGTVLGLLIVGIGLQLRGFDPGPLFILAAIVALVAFILGSREYTSLTIGAALGGSIGWYYIRDRPDTDMGAAIAIVGIILLVSMLLFRWTTAFLGAYPVILVSGIPVVDRPHLEVVGYGIVTALMILLPWMAIIIEDHPVVQFVQDRLPFKDRRLDTEEVGLPAE